VAPGFVGEEGEGVGFFSVFGDAEMGRGENCDGGKGGGELRHDERIVSAASGDDELVDFCFGENEAVESVHYGERGEESYSAKKIVGMGAMFFAQAEEFFDVGGAVVFTASGFWRRLAEIRISEKFVEKRGNGAAFAGEAGVFVEMLAAAGEVGDEGVDEHVGGAGVEGDDLGELGARGDDGDVGNAAEIEGDAAEFGVAVEEIVGVGNERSSLAADGDVGGTKIGDGGDAGAGGDDGGFAELQRGGGGVAEEGDGAALVEDGLAVAAD